VRAYVNRGNAYTYKSLFDRAIQDFNRAIELDPNDALAYFSRGQAKLNKGDRVGGNADIAKARSIDPNVGKT
jgi:tetratricopeptide (TPR) repeat protein